MVRTRGLDAHARSSRNAFGRVVYLGLSPAIETRPALFEPITRLALPVSPATHPSSPSRDDGHPPARPCYARNVTTALRGTTRESSDRPLQTNLFKEEDPEPFVDQRCRGFRRIRTDDTHGSRRTHRGDRLPSGLVRTSPFHLPRGSATSDAPRHRPTAASLAFALPSTAARPRPL